MLNILLIDDEYLVLRGVEVMLTHQMIFPVSVRSYIDSVEALRALPSLNPDVVVLDINMPELDGLSFIDQALAAGFEGSFIIISGYEDVNYLKRAFELHVADYLIKPINKQKLLDTLQTIYERSIQKEHSMLTQLRFMMVLSDNLHPSHYRRLDWERLFSFPYYALMCIRASEAQESTETAADRLRTFFRQLYSLHFNMGEVFLFGIDQAVQRRDLETIALQSGIVAENLPGYSRVVNREDILDAICMHNEMPLLLEAVADSVIRELKLPVGMPGPEDHAGVIMRRIIRNTNLSEISEAYQMLFLSGMSLKDAYDRAFIEGVSGLLIRHGYRTGKGQLKTLYETMWNSVSGSPTPYAVMADLPQQYLKLTSRMELVQEKYSEKIQEAIWYIHAHYAEDISLKDVADSVGLSSNYFSTMFSRELEETFVAYLKRIRLEEACRLLREKPHMSVETIAANVGYQTIGQFYKVFRSQFHESPNNWRRNHDGMRSASGQAKKRH